MQSLENNIEKDEAISDEPVTRDDCKAFATELVRRKSQYDKHLGGRFLLALQASSPDALASYLERLNRLGNSCTLNAQEQVIYKQVKLQTENTPIASALHQVGKRSYSRRDILKSALKTGAAYGTLTTGVLGVGQGLQMAFDDLEKTDPNFSKDPVTKTLLGLRQSLFDVVKFDPAPKSNEDIDGIVWRVGRSAVKVGVVAAVVKTALRFRKEEWAISPLVHTVCDLTTRHLEYQEQAVRQGNGL